MEKRARTPSRVGLAAAGVLCLASVVLAQSDSGGDGPSRLAVGFSGVLLDDVNMNDACAAIKIWTETVARNRGLPVTTTTEVFVDTAMIRKRLASREANLLVISMLDYLQIEGEGLADPWSVPTVGGKAFAEYLVLVHRDSGIQKLADLKGKSLLMEKTGYTNSLARLWLDVRLLEEGLPESQSVFQQIKEATRVARVCLPVFFRQGDACLVNRRGYETLTELNPQIGQQLVPLAASPKYPTSILCVSRFYQSDLRGELLKGLAELHQDARGQQILTIFRVDKLVAFEPSHLAQV
ncbi:MAG: phosphate/phosphite/phosphonate ABC transporter substrate-binding protein [Planctomycetes bacterium]|nr:phosphate/phosphite/phosphonate ABC transporter substrate-binding protein [Planctomycetota bacterium]